MYGGGCRLGGMPRQNVSREAVREEIPAVEVPRFDADSAYAYVAHQVSFGYRVPGTEAHRAAAEWLAAKLQACGATVTRQEAVLTAWDGTRLPSCNIIGSFAPEKATRVLLLAHWDSRPYADYDPILSTVLTTARAAWAYCSK